MSALVSICIPTYKQTLYLKRCLDSVVNQDYSRVEIIISDDSPDDAVKLFLDKEFPNLKYHYHKNIPSLGSPRNWNAAIQRAKGDYIKILHHDDFFTQSHSLSMMVNEISNTQSDFLFCQTDVWYTNKNTHRIQSVSDKQFRLMKEKPELLFYKNIIGAPSVILHKNKKEYKYDENFKWLVDVDFYLNALFLKATWCYIDKPLISTMHDVEGQITGAVLNDKEIQIREHILLFNKIKPRIVNLKGAAQFFDILFFKYQVKNFAELYAITPEAENNHAFYEEIIAGLPKFRFLKNFRNRFFESRYNNYIFKFEPYL